MRTITRIRAWWHEKVLHHIVIVGDGDWTTKDYRELRREFVSVYTFTHDLKWLSCSCGAVWQGTY